MMNYKLRKEKIIEYWKQGCTIKKILIKGFLYKEVCEILDKYTKDNAKKWLK